MHPYLKAKLGSIEETRRESRKKGAILVLLAVLFIVIFIFNYYYIKNPAIHNVFFPLFIGTIFLVIFGIVMIFQPLNNDEIAFCKIIDASKNLEDSIMNPDLRKLAHRKVLDAAKILEYRDIGNAPWYSKIKATEKRFIHNLKTRVAPAILEGKISELLLRQYALVFTNPDIDEMEKINRVIEEYEEIEIPETGYALTITSFLKSKIGKAISSILLGYTVMILLSLLYSLWIKKDFKLFLEENPKIILHGGAIIAGVFAPFFLLKET